MNGKQIVFKNYESFAAFLDSTGSSSAKVLCHMLKVRDENNFIGGTVREFSKWAGVSCPLVSSTIKTLYSLDLLRRVRNGLYMLSPHLISDRSLKLQKKSIAYWDSLSEGD